MTTPDSDYAVSRIVDYLEAKDRTPERNSSFLFGKDIKNGHVQLLHISHDTKNVLYLPMAWDTALYCSYMLAFAAVQIIQDEDGGTVEDAILKTEGYLLELGQRDLSQYAADLIGRVTEMISEYMESKE